MAQCCIHTLLGWSHFRRCNTVSPTWSNLDRKNKLFCILSLWAFHGYNLKYHIKYYMRAKTLYAIHTNNMHAMLWNPIFPSTLAHNQTGWTLGCSAYEPQGKRRSISVWNAHKTSTWQLVNHNFHWLYESLFQPEGGAHMDFPSRRKKASYVDSVQVISPRHCSLRLLVSNG